MSIKVGRILQNSSKANPTGEGDIIVESNTVSLGVSLSPISNSILGYNKRCDDSTKDTTTSGSENECLSSGRSTGKLRKKYPKCWNRQELSTLACVYPAIKYKCRSHQIDWCGCIDNNCWWYPAYPFSILDCSSSSSSSSFPNGYSVVNAYKRLPITPHSGYLVLLLCYFLLALEDAEYANLLCSSALVPAAKRAWRWLLLFNITDEKRPNDNVNANTMDIPRLLHYFDLLQNDELETCASSGCVCTLIRKTFVPNFLFLDNCWCHWNDK